MKRRHLTLIMAAADKFSYTIHMPSCQTEQSLLSLRGAGQIRYCCTACQNICSPTKGVFPLLSLQRVFLGIAFGSDMHSPWLFLPWTFFCSVLVILADLVFAAPLMLLAACFYAFDAPSMILLL